MWNWDYEEEGTNIRDGVRGTVISLVWERYHDVEILPEELVCVLRDAPWSTCVKS